MPEPAAIGLASRGGSAVLPGPKRLLRKLRPMLATSITRGLSLPALMVLALAGPSAEAGPDGAAIYRSQCASCHGPNGEGTKEDYPHPLTGERSVQQLAKLIAKTMPADDPGTCTGPDAEAVASYIHDAFYSPVAQARNRPPRIELSRLTVRQYRNALADLLGTFRGEARWGGERGLRGHYFNSRGFRDRARLIDRVDPVVAFDFGTAGPEPDKFDANQFSIRWEGSVLAPESGEYEFIVRSEHAVRLWVNDPRTPLIDALVKSGPEDEHRATITLLGGRPYSLRLEFSKAKQGVDDSKDKKKKPPEVKASVWLGWKPPKGVDEVIPARALSPERSPELFVSTASFPPDDRSVGYERGTSVSRAWEEATTEGAIEAAGYMLAHLNELAGTRDRADDRADKLRDFCRRFAERAFRRPLTDDQARVYVGRQFNEAKDPELAVKRCLLLVLKSPRFLYREFGPGLDAFDVAARLSFGLWDSLPDRELLDAAASGRLANREQVAAQAERMVADLRTRAKLRAFFLQWLRVDQAPDIAKDRDQFPGFDEPLVADLRASLDLTLEDLAWGESSDFRQLLLAETAFLNGRLARFYGVDLPSDAPFQKVPLEPGRRAGVLTHPYLLSAFAYTSTSSPIHRGVFLSRNVLGRALRPPPEAFTPLAPDLHPDLTTRQRVALQTSPASCIKCHGMINPLGFALEGFDAVGRYREEEKGQPIDATGSYETLAGDSATFNGPRELATFLAGSEEVHEAFVAQLFHHLVQQPILAFGPNAKADLRSTFAAHDYSIRRLMVEILASSALVPRQPAPEARGWPANPFADERHPVR